MEAPVLTVQDLYSEIQRLQRESQLTIEYWSSPVNMGGLPVTRVEYDVDNGVLNIHVTDTEPGHLPT